MPGILRLAPLEGEKAQSARESSTNGVVRPPKMTDRLKGTKNINERPKRVEPSVEESRRRRQRPPVNSSLRRTMETHKHCSKSAAARHQQNSDKSRSDTGTGTRAPKRNLRTASYQTQTAMPSRDRSLAALAALHSSYKSASSLVLESNDPSISASARAPADDMAIGSLQDKLMALAGRETTNTNNTKEQQQRVRSNSLDSGRDESLKGISARKPRAMAQEGVAASRRKLQRQILEDMRAKHQSARMIKVEPIIGSRRGIVQPGSNRGFRYKASSSSSSKGSPKPGRGRTYSPRPAKNTNENLRKKEKKTFPKPTKKSIESRVYFAPNDVDGAYQRLGWDTGATFQPRTEDRRYPPITTTSVLKRPARSSSVSDSLASGDTHSLTLGESSVDNSSVVAVESGAVSNQQKTSLPQLPGSLLVPFPSSRSNDDSSESPTPSLFESAEPTKLPPRSSIRAKMAAERANIPERISEENSDDCQEESMKSSPTTNASLASSSTRHYASDRTLPCSNLDKACKCKVSSNSSSGKDDSLVCSIPSQSSSELDNVSSSKYLSTPSQEDLYEDSSDDEDDDFFGGDESNDILAISLSLADVASDSFRSKANPIQKSPSAVSDKSKTSSLSTKSSDIHLRRQRDGSHASSMDVRKQNAPNTKEHLAFAAQGRGVEPEAASTQDSSDALFIIEDPESLLPTESQQGGANISDRAIFNRYWEKAPPKHHASNSGKDLLQVSRRHSLGEDTESSESAAPPPPPPPVWAKMEARHGGTRKNSPPIHIGIIEQDGTPLLDVPRRNIQRASMA